MLLKKGNKAPELGIPDQNGNVISLESLKGKKVVLYFYPKDNTPTCTVEACNIRDNYKALLDAGYLVYGISPDSPKKHVNFIQKNNLPFDLLADTDLKVVNAYGVWAKKQMYGREYMGVLRTTFIIDEKGKIAEVIEKVDSKNHTTQILS